MRDPVEFLKTIEGSTGIFFHSDCDGACSGALVLALLRQRRMKPKLMSGELDEEFFDAFANQKTKNVIFLDLAVDQYLEWVEPFKKRNALVIDHHVIHNDLNKMGFIHVNPRFKDPKFYTSASMITFDLCSKAGLKNRKWIAKLGATCDRAIKGTEKEREAASITDAVKAIRKEKGIVALAKYLSTCSSLNEFLDNDRYRRLKEMLDDEIEKQIALFDVTVSGKVNFFQVKSKYSITSIISSALSDMYPKRTIITYTKKGNVYKISGRSQEHNLAEAFSKASKNIGRGGGHPKAAGAMVTNFDLFKARIRKLLG